MGKPETEASHATYHETRIGNIDVVKSIAEFGHFVYLCGVWVLCGILIFSLASIPF